MRAAFICGVFGAATVASAAPPPIITPVANVAPARSPTTDETRLAASLIDLIHPDQQMFESNMKGWEAVARKTAEADPLYAKLESEYPGTINAAIENARPAAGEYSRDFVRKAKAKKTRIFASSLTGPELQQLMDFFRQPAGQRFVLKMQQPTEADDFAEGIVARAETDAPLTSDELQGTLRKQTKKVLSDLSADDLLVIAKFESQPLAKKFAAAGQQADLEILEIINNPDPEVVRRIGEAAIEGAVKFVEAKKRSKK